MKNNYYIDENLKEGFNPFEDLGNSLFNEPNDKITQVDIDWSLSDDDIEMRKYNYKSLTKL